VRKPAYCTAEGQAILAFQGDETVAARDRRRPHGAHPEDHHQPEKFGRELALTRQRGCAIEDEESELGMVSIAAPIRDEQRRRGRAVGIAGPVTRLTKKSIAAFMPHVIATADQCRRGWDFATVGWPTYILTPQRRQHLLDVFLAVGE